MSSWQNVSMWRNSTSQCLACVPSIWLEILNLVNRFVCGKHWFIKVYLPASHFHFMGLVWRSMYQEAQQSSFSLACARLLLADSEDECLRWGWTSALVAVAWNDAHVWAQLQDGVCIELCLYKYVILCLYKFVIMHVYISDLALF